MKKQSKGEQLSTSSNDFSDLEQISFNATKQDQLIQNNGVTFIHYKAMPSPIGLKERGDYRRSDSLDVVSENGFIYRESGCFTAVMFANHTSKEPNNGGLTDSSTTRLTLPRFYDKTSDQLPDEEIHICVGDRLFIKDLETLTVNYQQVEYIPDGSDFLQFPAKCVELLIDSQGNEYKEGVHFKINKEGNIVWGSKNPGLDVDTGKGRVYSVRYKYQAHWYVIDLLNEIRVANITENNERGPVRMPYQIHVQREYVYHNRIKVPENKISPKIKELSDKTDKKQQSRKIQDPIPKRETNSPKVKVNISDIE